MHNHLNPRPDERILGFGEGNGYRSRGSWWRGFGSVFLLGTRHIAEGTDHLLFLLVLLLPAPLIVKDKRWRAGGSTARSVKEVLRIVTAFTVGHSVTLVCAAAHVLRVPSAPVEILIAVSILGSALHAMRPMFAGHEPLIAAGFGLIHGLAFATVLADFGFDAWTLGMSVLGFNLGIEAMQLLVVVLVMPWLLWWSRTEAYRGIRLAGAALGAVAACGWVGERALGLQNPAAPMIDLVFQHGLYVIALMALVTIAVAMSQQRAFRTAPREDAPDHVWPPRRATTEGTRPSRGTRDV